ncbi:acyl-CoA thioesterase II [Mesorhizobium australicum]|jgi:acyl-CoA thioesterase II|uniref:Acyl-CoA thioesterase II n=1 Tax=Mesorhizobium australicum TaxID=536018 RepID=A0ACC6SXQ0_9HYPH|nr:MULTISPECIES: acyl-CoA thioesterase II [unclassified Mesorhizobium]TGR38585.1 acyl-CoA thioesterase II [bacterium M00.F.Ca.ET.199.01.1.1]TGU28049.1 acyl-CoA thioesterase II [bacterium M00.F.Ca.ET.156.01.1.1]TGU91168.1 acyl-CoA thioesterase II [Mesorhizobium sp. M00.F.Ca.ET.151.01.1.1]TGV10887.1 acyl-CoA thioesterase II [Mesorhizobium sp. M8A.F.Ca.ET.173.01.1.1]TGV51226.1 acyl-CoA thioesterase II [bacterium M00.F.Ca.ET.141.01.1.1]TGV83582.1 acyl-CoA thioesterase II [Mesorhizobium sp. M00.F.
MTAAIDELLRILDLERLEHNLYRGRSPQVEWQRVFGGQTIAQALVAAQRTVEPDRFVHSLHGYFMRPGDIKVPIIYEVDRIRDGGSFTTRRVLAIQHGQAIFSLEASFQVDEKGLEHQFALPDDVPPPEGLKTQRQLLETADRVPEAVRRFWARERPLELRPVNLQHYESRDKLPPRQNVWIRLAGPVPDDRALQSVLLAYLSDMTLLDTSTFAHGRGLFDPDIQAASLDHSMWFHRPHSLDGWLLYAQDSPSSSGSRGFSRGTLYARDGTLIASMAQEGLIRLKR